MSQSRPHSGLGFQLQVLNFLKVFPLRSEELSDQTGPRTYACKPSPECGLDCLTCAIFARQRLGVEGPPPHPRHHAPQSPGSTHTLYRPGPLFTIQGPRLKFLRPLKWFPLRTSRTFPSAAPCSSKHPRPRPPLPSEEGTDQTGPRTFT